MIKILSLQEFARRRASIAMREEAARRERRERRAREKQAQQESADLQVAIQASLEMSLPEPSHANPKPSQASPKPVVKLQEPQAKRPRLSRAAKRLENCPGVKEASASGRIMKSIPDLWRAKAEPGEDIKLADIAAELNTRLAEAGATAGLLGLDSTFSFSPLKLRDGKFLFQNFFNCTFCYEFPHGVRYSVIWEVLQRMVCITLQKSQRVILQNVA